MNMNIGFEASRVIQIVKTGHTEVQKCEFAHVWQTPTDITYMIAGAADPVQAYKDWVMSQEGCVEEEPIFADDDPFCEEEPIGHETIDYRLEHLEIFTEWLAKMDEGSWNVKPVIG